MKSTPINALLNAPVVDRWKDGDSRAVSVGTGTLSPKKKFDGLLDCAVMRTPASDHLCMHVHGDDP
jgi:hypothetical protein